MLGGYQILELKTKFVIGESTSLTNTSDLKLIKDYLISIIKEGNKVKPVLLRFTDEDGTKYSSFVIVRLTNVGFTFSINDQDVSAFIVAGEISSDLELENVYYQLLEY